jgi:hypothetical protein
VKNEKMRTRETPGNENEIQDDDEKTRMKKEVSLSLSNIDCEVREGYTRYTQNELTLFL